MKILLVIDAQNDFIDGTLSNPAAQQVMNNLITEVAEKRVAGYKIMFTRDTHYATTYPNSLEGKYLPIPHCLIFTKGWEVAPGLSNDADIFIDKYTFGCENLKEEILRALSISELDEGIDEIELVGFCTDICVISNALILKAQFEDIIITCNASCCAGTSEEAHRAALTVMRSCQVEIKND